VGVSRVLDLDGVVDGALSVIARGREMCETGRMPIWEIGDFSWLRTMRIMKYEWIFTGRIF